MRKYYTFFSHKIIFILVFLVQNLLIQAQVSPELPSPLHRCWELNIEGINKTEVASDNANQVFISYQNGTLAAINLSDGNQNWKTELGADIVSLTYKDSFLYVVSLNQADASIIIRALGAETGLTKWQQTLSAGGLQQSVESYHPLLVQTGDFLFFATAGGDLYKLAKDTGKELEKSSLGEKITTSIKLSDQKITFGTDRKNIIVYSIPDKTTAKIRLTEIPTVIYIEPERIITGDIFGKLTSLKIKTNKKEWQTRVGAEVSDLTETTEGLAVSSNDNFIYLISSKNGGKIWKKRFGGRTATTIDPVSRNLLAAVNLNGDTAALLDTGSGKTINQIKLTDSAFFTGKPLFLSKSLIFKTNTGLISYSSDLKCSEKERPEDNSGL